MAELKISKEMLINDIIQVNDGIVPILTASGMHCVGCMAAAGESLEEAAVVHGIDVDALTDRINNYLVTLNK